MIDPGEIVKQSSEPPAKSGWLKRTVEKWGDKGKLMLPDLLHPSTETKPNRALRLDWSTLKQWLGVRKVGVMKTVLGGSIISGIPRVF